METDLPQKGTLNTNRREKNCLIFFTCVVSCMGGGLRLFLCLKLKLRYGTSRNEQNFLLEFYVYGSVHRRSILIIVQQDATQSSLFIILQVHSTSFGCQPHPSSGVHKTITTASGTVQLPPSNVANLATLEGGSCTKNMRSTGGCSYSFVYS